MGAFVMPSLGADMRAGTLVAWRVEVGDRVKRGDIIAEVETEKGVIEVEVFVDGVVERLLVAPGTKVPVGTPLALLGEGAAEASAPAIPLAAGVRTEPPRAPPLPVGRPGEGPPAPPSTVAYVGPTPDLSHRDTPAARRRARSLGVDLEALREGERAEAGGRITVDVVERAARGGGSGAPLQAGERGIRVSPVARRRARVLGLDVATIAPTPSDGVVHLRDVERAAVEGTGAHGVAPEDPKAAMRRVIATTMARSKREIPHYYLGHTVDLGPAMDLLRVENERRSVAERLLPVVLLLKATALALREVPELNAHFEGGAAAPRDRVHLGVAIALRGGGLVAPALHDADRMTLTELMRAFQDLVARTRTGTLRGSELTEATATVTSLGERGVETVFPIIAPPQVAMIGFGRIVERPWVVEGAVVPRPVVTVSLAADHRVSDGHRGGLFLTAIERRLAHPEEL